MKEIMPETKKINTKELTKLISNEIDYNIYEVSDVLKGLSDVIQEQLQQGNSVKLQGLGTFHPKPNLSKNYRLPTGELCKSEGSMGVRFAPDAFLVKSLNTKG